GIQEQVDSLGFVDAAQLPELLRQASVFAIPSDQEGLCISALEGMACGLPVVSTRCGGPEAFVVPGQTGLVVERNNEAEMADALHSLLTEPDTRQRMAQQAR